MDPATLAAFRASGETDLNKFLAKQAGQQADLPPGVGAYSGGAAGFQGTTSAERGAIRSPQAGADDFGSRLARGFGNIINYATSAGQKALGFVSPAAGDQTAAASNGNILASRTGALEDDLNALQARSTRFALPSEKTSGKQFLTGQPLVDPTAVASLIAADKARREAALKAAGETGPTGPKLADNTY